MLAISDIPEDDLLLARLVCRKLAKLLGGMLSVGLSALHFDSPETFFTGRDRLILAMTEVLRYTGVRPGSESASDLNQRTARLSNLADDFFSGLMALAHWREMNTEEIQRASHRLAASYADCLAALQELLQDLGSAGDYSPQQVKGRELIGCVIGELAEKRAGQETASGIVAATSNL